MNKDHLADARRCLLGYWLDLVEDAIRRQSRDSELLRTASNGPITTPPLVIPMPSQDMMELLLGGIRNALDGKKDPFGIAISTRGRRSCFDRQGWLDVVREVLGEIERNRQKIERDGSLAYGKRDPVTEAIAIVAERHGLSTDAVTKAFGDRDNRIATLMGPIFVNDD